MSTDPTAGMAEFVDRERWRRVRKFEDERLRMDKSTVDDRFRIFEMMCRHVRSLGAWPDQLPETVPEHKLRLARIVNARL